MPTTSTRTRRSPAATTGRFTRSTSAGPRKTTARRRPATPQRRGLAGGWLQRSQPQKSRLDRALGGLKRQSKTSSSKTGKRGKVGGGLALLAGAAGLLFKNRDKVVSMARRDGGTAQAPATPPMPGTAPTNAGAGDVTPR